MLWTVWQLKSQAQWVALSAFIALALWRGAGPERRIACVFIFMFVADRIYHALFGNGRLLLNADLGHVLIDAAALAGFVWIALRANRVYPLWLASFQLMTLVSHVVRALSPSVATGAYAILIFAPSYLEVLVFGLGLLLHIRRQAKFGPYRSWRSS